MTQMSSKRVCYLHFICFNLIVCQQLKTKILTGNGTEEEKNGLHNNNAEYLCSIWVDFYKRIIQVVYVQCVMYTIKQMRK